MIINVIDLRLSHLNHQKKADFPCQTNHKTIKRKYLDDYLVKYVQIKLISILLQMITIRIEYLKFILLSHSSRGYILY